MSERPGAVRTARLDLVPGTIDLYEDELASPERLGHRLGAFVPEGWPPGEYDRGAITYFIERAREGGDEVAGWYAWYIVWRGGAGGRDALAGSIGYFGPPRDGSVELGYSVVESFRGRGIASEAVEAFTARALAAPGVTRVIAHTAEDNAHSRGALRRAGFSETGPGRLPGTRRFERLVVARVAQG